MATMTATAKGRYFFIVNNGVSGRTAENEYRSMTKNGRSDGAGLLQAQLRHIPQG